MRSLRLRLFIAVLLVLVLTIVPLPVLLVGLKPSWVLLLILYLQCFLPEYFNVLILLVLGFVLDILLSTAIGEHALALSLVTWVANGRARRFGFFSLSQQVALIGFFCLVYQVSILTIDAFLGYRIGFFMSLGGVLTSMILWPWVKRLADDAFFVRATVCQ